MRKSFTLFLICMITQLLGASYYVDVQTYGKCSLEGKTFFLMSSDGSAATDLEFKHYSKYVASYLIFNGGSETTQFEDADLCIFVGYGIGESRPLVRNHPIYGNDGVASVSTSTDVFGTTHSYVTPSVGVVGYTQSQTDQYRRYIDIYIYDNQSFVKDMEPEMLWKANIESIGYKNDLKALFPYMMYAARNYIGVDLETKKHISLTDDCEKDVLFQMVKSGEIRKGCFEHNPRIDYNSDEVRRTQLEISAIQFSNLATYIWLDYKTQIPCTISNNICLEYNNTRLSPREVIGTVLGYSINKYTRNILLRFDPIPPNVKVISLKDEKKKRALIWEGIHINQSH